MVESPVGHTDECDVVIVGGGPAGLFSANLLSRLGLSVIVLEKHADFLRDWRGDTVHPTTMGLIERMGLEERFGEFPMGRLRRMRMRSNGHDVTIADFRFLPMKHKYIAIVPQWELLNMLAEDAQATGRCDVRMECTAQGVLKEPGGTRVSGVVYTDKDGTRVEVRARLSVASDGRRSSMVRDMGWRLRENRVGMDAWQVRIPKANLPDWQEEVLGSYANGLAAVAQDRHDYVQAAFLILKGSDAELRGRGIEWLRDSLVELFGWSRAAVDAIKSFDEVPFLDVRSGILPRWHTAGLVCIGDSAHPMSPAGGVGVNCAVQDAVCLANAIAADWNDGLPVESLARVRRRRSRAAWLVQRLQKGEEDGIILPALRGQLEQEQLPPFLKTIDRIPAAPYAAALLSTFMVLPEKLHPIFIRPAVNA